MNGDSMSFGSMLLSAKAWRAASSLLFLDLVRTVISSA
jgi:hypothetical protein